MFCFSAFISVRVQLIRSSENPPYFIEEGETVTVEENEPLNSTIVIVQATDEDPGIGVGVCCTNIISSEWGHIETGLASAPIATTCIVFIWHLVDSSTCQRGCLHKVCGCAFSEFNVAQYEIVEGNEKRLFAIDKMTGRISNTGFLIYDEQPVSAYV